MQPGSISVMKLLSCNCYNVKKAAIRFQIVLNRLHSLKRQSNSRHLEVQLIIVTFLCTSLMIFLVETHVAFWADHVLDMHCFGQHYASLLDHVELVDGAASLIPAIRNKRVLRSVLHFQFCLWPVLYVSIIDNR